MEVIKSLAPVFVPFLGDFFSISYKDFDKGSYILSVFVPFLGDFFSIITSMHNAECLKTVFVPFLGDFFSMFHGAFQYSFHDS